MEQKRIIHKEQNETYLFMHSRYKGEKLFILTYIYNILFGTFSLPVMNRIYHEKNTHFSFLSPSSSSTEAQNINFIPLYL